MIRAICCVIALLWVPLVAHAETENDPFEGWNRAMFSFNQKADKYVLKPLAEGYQAITPAPVRKGVSNFFNNLGEPITAVNSVLQAKPGKAARSLTRFVFNTTFGLLGIFDVAGAMGIEREKEDLGQTLAYWGVGSGPYLVLPILGPSNLRDLGGRVVDRPLNPVSWQDKVGMTEVLFTDGIQTRAQLLGVEPKSVGDPYVLMRSTYEQRRRYEINDGIVVDLFLDDPFLDDPSAAQ
jgi:phospholipid-binding lipoprotein MlaA